MNKVRKGNRRQLATRRKLEAEGWRVETARRSSYLGEKIDFFGIWDIIAYKLVTPELGWCRIKLIQVKSNYCPPIAKQALIDFKVDGIIVLKELWIYKDYDRKSPYIEQIGNFI